MRTNTSLPLASHRNFLLVQHQKLLGAALHATPLVATLKAVLPDARIIVAASGFAKEVFADNTHIERLIDVPDARENLFTTAGALRRARLFEGAPFVSLQTLGNLRPHYPIAAALAGSSANIPGDVPGGNLSTVDSRLSWIAKGIRLVELLGHGEKLEATLRANPNLQRPQFFYQPNHLNAAKALLQTEGLDFVRPLAVFITQSSPDPAKTWPAERWQDIATWLHQNHGFQIVFDGTAKQQRAIDKVRAPLGFPTFSTAGRTSVSELAALLSLADVALSVDTGPLHLARAVGLPTVAIVPASRPPIEWFPLQDPRLKLLWHAYGPTHGGYDLDSNLSAAEVQRALSDLLAAYPSRSRAAATTAEMVSSPLGT